MQLGREYPEVSTNYYAKKYVLRPQPYVSPFSELITYSLTLLTHKINCVCVAETRGDVAADPRRLHAKQGPVRPGADSTVPREGRLHLQGVGGVVHVAQVQDHEE